MQAVDGGELHSALSEAEVTVAELKHILGQCKPDSLVFIRLDDDALDNLRGPVCEIVGHEYGYGCTSSLALMLECGQPEEVTE